ncbi:hypothetical protein C6496_10130 [Candidatus Poribacteria bacterium]|nr:MAG: hypothetical protein C6496_10130 [Candidatus Poribacteria bacterium]
MKHIGFIFLILIFSVLPVFGQISNSNLQVSDLQQADFGHEKPISHLLIAQSETGEASETPPTTESTPEEHAEKLSPQVETTDQQNIEITNPSPNERKRRILRIANDYELGADGVLTTLIVIAGDVRLQGTVTGNMLILGGNVTLTQESQVSGTLQIIGGQVSGPTEAVAGLQVSNHWKMIPAGAKLLMRPYIFWKITSKQANLRLTLVEAGISVLMYLLIFAAFPRPINATGEMLARRPMGSVLFGILMLPVIPLILTLLMLSIIGVPLMLLALTLLVPLAIFGKTAIFVTLGGTLFSGRLKPLGIIFCYILYFMATALPHIDWVTFLLVNAISIGLCVLSGISAMLPQNPRQNISWSERV